MCSSQSYVFDGKPPHFEILNNNSEKMPLSELTQMWSKNTQIMFFMGSPWVFHIQVDWLFLGVDDPHVLLPLYQVYAIIPKYVFTFWNLYIVHMMIYSNQGKLCTIILHQRYVHPLVSMTIQYHPLSFIFSNCLFITPIITQ